MAKAVVGKIPLVHRNAESVQDHRAAPHPKRIAIPLDETKIDIAALKVVRRLVEHGHEAYLVGGGVRDLLLGMKPKDFDIATSALPNEIRKLFRNSRTIGRRFRLVHILFAGNKIIEVATFRREPDPATIRRHGRIREDNAFGEAYEDAARRDLRINALFYDISKQEVLDFVDGMSDVQDRIIRTIGDPNTRFREDPVRMIRAIKFSARLDLAMGPEVYDAIVACCQTITTAARPRLLEELLKVLRSGASRRSFWLMWETGLLHLLLPELATYIDDRDDCVLWDILSEVDCRNRSDSQHLQDVATLLLLLHDPMQEWLAMRRDHLRAAQEFLLPAAARLAIPNRMVDAICRVAVALPRVRSKRLGRFAKSELLPLANEVLSVLPTT